MAKKVTTANTGLSIARNGNKFTASWKIKTKNPKSQKIRYRKYNGKKWDKKWTTKTIGKNATSFSFTLDPSKHITSIQVQTQILKDDNKYQASAWKSSSAFYKPEVPPKPTLTVENTSANATTFTWSISTSATNKKWHYRCMYRTKCDTDPDGSKGWSSWAHAASNTYSYTDNTLGTTRIFQIKAVGPKGDSKTVTERHAINTAPIATWGKPEVTYTTESSYYSMTYNVNITGSTYRVDKVVPQYLIDTPTSTMGAPDNAWTDGTNYTYNSSKNDYQMAVATSSLVGLDKCLWARVKTEHDSVEQFSEPYMVIKGNLTPPELTLSIGTITAAGFTVTANVDDAGTDVPGAYMEVYLERYSKMGRENYILIGTIANGVSSKTINCTENITGETGYAIHVRNVTADGKSMTSDFYSYKTSMASAPTFSKLLPTTTDGKVYLSWTNNWSDATGVIIAWTDDPDNWMSNEEPETYEIKEIASNWFITGLETGRKWYFRIRNVMEVGDSKTLSPWSQEKDIDLASAPVVPSLELSEETITEDGMVTAYWSYVSSDGTGQIAGNIVEATYSGGVWSYGRSVGSTTTAQHIDITAKDWGWTNGSTIYLALQTRAGSGGMSEYSTPKKLVIAAKPTVAITSTSLVSSENLTESFLGDGTTKNFDLAYNMAAAPTVKVNGSTVTVSSYNDDIVTLASAPANGADVVVSYRTTDNRVLNEMPMTFQVATTSAKDLTVAIERDEAYPMSRPDGTTTDGSAGETVYVETIPANGSNNITITLDDLLDGGRLDDGALYNLVATASDEYGQTTEPAEIRFKVHWKHQAVVPFAVVTSDSNGLIAHITPYDSEDTLEWVYDDLTAAEMATLNTLLGLSESTSSWDTSMTYAEYKTICDILGMTYEQSQTWDLSTTVNERINLKQTLSIDIVAGDTCDIYRLSADLPELIFSGANFGTEYVDPYPAFGPDSGYMVLLVTETGDYITEANTFAEVNTREDIDYNELDVMDMVIDFDGERIALPYNITLGNSWSKDFERTTYLGGHVTGDHNVAVTRDLSASSVLIRNVDEDTVMAMRRLSMYPGVCHIRTPEGSSFAADIQVSEEQSYDKASISYNLSVQKIDTIGFDGMTLADWSEQQNELE